MYLARVKVPKAPSPWEKLPKRSMMTGQTVRNPTMAIRMGVRRAIGSPQKHGALTWVYAEKNVIPFPDVCGRLDPGDQTGFPDPDFPFIGITDKHEGLHLAR